MKRPSAGKTGGNYFLRGRRDVIKGVCRYHISLSQVSSIAQSVVLVDEPEKTRFLWVEMIANDIVTCSFNGLDDRLSGISYVTT